MLTSRVCSMAAGVCAAAFSLGCERLPADDDVPSARPSLRGITFVDWTRDGYGTMQASASLAELADTGANTLAIVATFYQESGASTQVIESSESTASQISVAFACADARALGLDVVLVLHVDVIDGSWRGLIDPTDRVAWFASYGALAETWAAFAWSQQCAGFVAGCELASISGDEASWRSLLARVREEFSGAVYYAASWDEAESVPFWDAVDAIGVNFYGPVAARPNAGRLELLEGWQPWLARLERLHRVTGLPVFLTEVGYRSRDGAGMRPSDFTSHAAIDIGEQADLYWAALEAAAQEPWIEGLFWWNWHASAAGGAMDGDYTPRGKPAADVLQRAWKDNALP